MALWNSLYLMIWVVFLEFWLSLTPVAPPVPYYLHAALGIGIVALAYYNWNRLRATTAPGRIKRISQGTLGLTLLMGLLGGLLFLHVGDSVTLFAGITVWGAIKFFHFVNAVAIVTQAASTATSYDMWEEKEFLIDTRPGEVPAAPKAGTTKPSVPAAGPRATGP